MYRHVRRGPASAGQLASHSWCKHHLEVEPLVDRDDVTALLSGVFDLNMKLATVSEDVHVIRQPMEDDDGEEEEEKDVGPPA